MDNIYDFTWEFEPVTHGTLPSFNDTCLQITSHVPVNNLDALFGVNPVENATANMGDRYLKIICVGREGLSQLINYCEENGIFEFIPELVATNTNSAVKIKDVKLLTLTKNTNIEIHVSKIIQTEG